MASIGDLVISLRADIASFRTGMDQANKSLTDVKSQFSSAKQAAQDFFEVLGGFIASHEIINFLKDSAEATRSWADQLATFQGLAGLSSTAAATLAASSQLAGVQTDVVAQAMARLGTIMATHPEKLVQIGVASSVAALRQMSLTDAMRATIGALDQYKAGTDRAEAAGFALGKGAEAWITQLDKLGPELTAANWNENAELVKGLGLAMENGKATAAEWARAEGTLKLELLGVQNQIGTALLPVLKEFGTTIAALAKDGSLKRWADDGSAVIRAFATDVGLAVKAVDLLVAGLNSLTVADNKNFDREKTTDRKSILRPWTPSPSGGFTPPDMSGAVSGLNNPSAAGAGGAPPDGTKTFNVPDPKLEAFNAEYDKLLANYRMDLDYQNQLKVAYTEGAVAVRQLQVDHAGELAVYKLLDEAEAKHVAISDQQLEAARKLAEADEASKLVTDEQKKATDAMVASVKAKDEAMQKLVQTADLLTPKEQQLADSEGLLVQAFDRGLISAQAFNDKLKELTDQFNGPDKGMKDFTSGLSTDLTGLIGKLTDFSAIAANKQKGQSIFQQLTQDSNEFLKSLQDLLLKLLIINPLLNALGLGDQGNGKQLPTLLGSSGGSGSLTSLLGTLFGGGSPKAYANGGDFVVGGNGGVDSSLVMFKATPGEPVSVGANASRETLVNHHYIYSPTFITPNVESFKKTNDQHGADAMRQMLRAGRYAS